MFEKLEKSKKFLEKRLFWQRIREFIFQIVDQFIEKPSVVF
jgi:hypothetical protein